MAFDFKAFFAGVALTVVGIATNNPLLAIGGLSLVTRGIGAPDDDRNSSRSRREGTLASGVSTENSLPIVYGLARVGPWIVFQDTRDTSRGPNTRMDMVAAFCLGNRETQFDGEGEIEDPYNGEIEGYGSIFFDDKQAVDASGHLTDFYNALHPSFEDNSFAHFRHLGSHDQLADVYMIETAGLTGENAWNDPESDWTFAHQGRGIAYIVFAFRFPTSGDKSSTDEWLQRRFPGGVPNITAMIKGRRIYDPRTDEWAWSDNAALVIRDYLLDNKVGGALSLTHLDEASFIAEADVADEVISDDEAETVARRYTINGAVDTGVSVLQNLQTLLFAGGYYLPFEQGTFRLRRLDQNAPLSDFVLDETTMIGDWSILSGEPNERTNRMIAKYVDAALFDAEKPKDQVLSVEVPAVGTYNEYVVEDSGMEIPREIDLPFTIFEINASTRAAEELAHARADLTVTCRAVEAATVLSFGDRVIVSHVEAGMNEKVFWVIGVGLNPDVTVSLTLRETDRGIPPPPPELVIPVPDAVAFNGKPFENLYADGRNWIGNLFSTGTINWTRIFDVVTGEEVKVLTTPSELSSNFGYGYAYHPERKEMWMLGESGGATKIAIYDTLTMEHKVTYTYAEYDSQTPYSIEYCPLNGYIYAAMQKNPETEATVVEIDPATGTILRSWTPATFEIDESACESIAAGHEFQMVWHPVDQLFYVGKQRDYIWTFSPVTGAKTALSGAVGGLIDSGEFVCEQEYSAADNRIYLVPDARHAVYRYPTVLGSQTKPEGSCVSFNTGLSPWKSYVGGQSDPKAFQVLALPKLHAVAVCRGDTSLIYSDPTKTGRVTVYDVHHGGILRDFIIKFNPARMSYVPDTDSICVVSYWKQDSEWYVQWLPLTGITNLPPPADDPAVPGDPTVPGPTPEPEPDDSPPEAGGPTITAGRDYCSDGLVETPPDSDLWDGTIVSGVEIDYTDDAGHVNDPVEVLVYPVGADPDFDAISILGGVDVDSNTIRLQTFSETHDQVPSEERPVCPGNTNFGTRDDIDQFWDVYLRYEGETALSNKITVRVRNPQRLVSSPDPTDPDPPAGPTPPYDAPFWTSGLGSGTCSTGQNLATNMWETRVYAALNCWAAHYGNDGYGQLPVEYGEFEAGANPNTATPIRTHIMAKTGPTYPYNWLVYFDTLPIGGGQMTACGTTGGVTRDYYARHIINSVTYGPWSAKLATMTHRPPIRVTEA